MKPKTNEKILNELISYRRLLESSYLDDAWKYFEYEKLKLHPVWNGYRCIKCKSINALKNKEGLCIKCLVLKEKISVLDKVIQDMKGGKELWKEIQKLTYRR